MAPAAHYMMGGVRVNTWGETSVAGLFATGEVACTGVHGANRLASNSMLEVLVFSKRIVERTLGGGKPDEVRPARQETRRYRLPSRSMRTVWMPFRAEVQSLLWEKVGIIRSGQGLAEATDMLAAWEAMLAHPTDRPSYELSNMILAGRLMAEAALLREESRGAHFRTDFPERSPEWQCHIVFTRQ